MIQLKGVNFIAGKESAKGSHKFNSINPRTRETSKIQIHEALENEINQAFFIANEAFKLTRNFSDEEKATFLETVAEEIMKLDNQLLEIGDWETALGEIRLNGERNRTCNQLKLFASFIRTGNYKEIIIDNGDPARQPSPKPDIRRILIPLGPVGIFGASNFPFAFGIIGGDTVSAWAAGCPVIAKSHPSHPLTSELFSHAIYRAIIRCNFPPGFFSLIQGDTIETGKCIVQNPYVKAIGFTGSLKGGRTLFNIANQRKNPIPVYAEMGSINPIFVMPSIFQQNEENLNEIAETFVNSITLGVGQFCTKPGVFFFSPEENQKRLIALIKEKMASKSHGTLLNNQICKTLENTTSLLKNLQNIDLGVGGNLIINTNSFENTLFITDYKEYQNNPELQTEKFGPVAIIVKCLDVEDFYDIAENLEGQLTGAIFFKDNNSRENAQIEKLSEILQYKVGRLIFNNMPTGVEVCHAMHHGGPYPATTSERSTSVGTTAIQRFLRPLAFQNAPDAILPKELQNQAKKPSLRMIDGRYQL